MSFLVDELDGFSILSFASMEAIMAFSSDANKLTEGMKEEEEQIPLKPSKRRGQALRNKPRGRISRKATPTTVQNKNAFMTTPSHTTFQSASVSCVKSSCTIESESVTSFKEESSLQESGLESSLGTTSPPPLTILMVKEEDEKHLTDEETPAPSLRSQHSSPDKKNRSGTSGDTNPPFLDGPELEVEVNNSSKDSLILEPLSGSRDFSPKPSLNRNVDKATLKEFTLVSLSKKQKRSRSLNSSRDSELLSDALPTTTTENMDTQSSSSHKDEATGGRIRKYRKVKTLVQQVNVPDRLPPSSLSCTLSAVIDSVLQSGGASGSREEVSSVPSVPLSEKIVDFSETSAPPVTPSNVSSPGKISFHTTQSTDKEATSSESVVSTVYKEIDSLVNHLPISRVGDNENHNISSLSKSTFTGEPPDNALSIASLVKPVIPAASYRTTSNDETSSFQERVSEERSKIPTPTIFSLSSNLTPVITTTSASLSSSSSSETNSTTSACSFPIPTSSSPSSSSFSSSLPISVSPNRHKSTVHHQETTQHPFIPSIPRSNMPLNALTDPNLNPFLNFTTPKIPSNPIFRSGLNGIHNPASHDSRDFLHVNGIPNSSSGLSSHPGHTKPLTSNSCSTLPSSIPVPPSYIKSSLEPNQSSSVLNHPLLPSFPFPSSQEHRTLGLSASQLWPHLTAASKNGINLAQSTHSLLQQPQPSSLPSHSAVPSAILSNSSANSHTAAAAAAAASFQQQLGFPPLSAGQLSAADIQLVMCTWQEYLTTLFMAARNGNEAAKLEFDQRYFQWQRICAALASITPTTTPVNNPLVSAFSHAPPVNKHISSSASLATPTAGIVSGGMSDQSSTHPSTNIYHRKVPAVPNLPERERVSHQTAGGDHRGVIGTLGGNIKLSNNYNPAMLSRVAETLPARSKVQGKWCGVHGKIAWFIHRDITYKLATAVAMTQHSQSLHMHRPSIHVPSLPPPSVPNSELIRASVRPSTHRPWPPENVTIPSNSRPSDLHQQFRLSSNVEALPPLRTSVSTTGCLFPSQMPPSGSATAINQHRPSLSVPPVSSISGTLPLHWPPNFSAAAAAAAASFTNPFTVPPAFKKPRMENMSAATAAATNFTQENLRQFISLANSGLLQRPT